MATAALTVTQEKKRTRKKSFGQKLYPFHFVLGALILYVGLYVVPSLMGIYYSFTDWSQFNTGIHFVGLANYKAIFVEDNAGVHYLQYIFNTLKFTGITTVLKGFIALGLAMLVNKGIRFKNLHRGLIFLPAILSFIVTGLVFKSILHPTTGLLNHMLTAVGLESFTQSWLTDPSWVFTSIYAVDAWKGVGYLMTIFLAGLQTIPEEYYEAAEIDGARFWRKFIHVTLPLLMPALMVTSVLSVLYGLRVFDIIYVLTNGGPGDITDVLYTVVLKTFGYGYYAIGSALSSILFVFMIIIGYFMIQFMIKNEVEY
jgi:raffinose/stachyose/melibiose transport system permease protein